MNIIDLSATSGLPLALESDSGFLVALGDSLRLEEPGRRSFAALRAVAAEPEAIDPIADEAAYLTYRDVRRAAEAGLAASGLRYDVTVTLPGTVGSEYVKTAGHYHGLNPEGVSWPEIYDVLSGSAVFVLQRAEGDPAGDPVVTRAIAVIAAPGDRLVIPPGYGHVTVNVGDTPLVVADLVASRAQNHYQSFARRRGAAVRVMTSANAPFATAWNPSYPAIDSGVEVMSARDLDAFEPGVPLYALGVGYPECVTFLTHPSLSAFDI